MTNKHMKRDPRHTYGDVMYAIREHGIEKVRKTVFHGDENMEGVAMVQYINSRMHADDIIDKLTKENTCICGDDQEQHIEHTEDCIINDCDCKQFEQVEI